MGNSWQIRVAPQALYRPSRPFAFAEGMIYLLLGVFGVNKALGRMRFCRRPREGLQAAA